MDTREWVFILGVIAIVIVALVLAARWRRQRFDDIQPGRYAHDEGEGSSDEGLSSAELPAGGARTVGYRDPTDIERMNDEIRARAEASKPRLSSFRPEPVEQGSLLLDDEYDETDQDASLDENQASVPLLLDPSDQHNRVATEDSPVELATPVDLSLDKSAEVQELEALADDLKEPEPELQLRAAPEDRPSRAADKKPAARKPTDSKPAKRAQQKAEPKQTESQQKAPEEPGEIVIINLMTDPAVPFQGEQLYKVVFELGMRHGDMEIFHYCGRHGDEQPQFRMANLLKPGYFDLKDINKTRTHALCFFFELMGDQDNMKTYESMLSVINRIRDELGGEMHDENRSVFTIQTSEHCRNRIRDYQRRRLLNR